MDYGIPTGSTGDTPIPNGASDQTDMSPVAGVNAGQVDEEVAKQRRLVQKILRDIKRDKDHHKKAFDQMREDMRIARTGHDKEWPHENYAANISGRIIRQKTAALYAKDPKAVARRPERLDFKVWDENPDSLKLAYATIQMAQAAAAASAVGAPMPGAPTVPGAPPPMPGAPISPQPQMPPGFEQAMATIADFQQGLMLRQQMERVGRTLEILYAHALRTQKPLDFKTAMKKVVRRACTTGVAYIEMGFQRTYQTDPEILTQISDTEARLAHLRELAKDASEGEISGDDPEISELENTLASLMAAPQVVAQEGLLFDYPPSTSVIPDMLCKSLVGFVGGRHLTIEYLFTVEQVEEMFPDADLDQGFSKYESAADTDKGIDLVKDASDDYDNSADSRAQRPEMVRVFKYYDKPSGMVYFVADGYRDFLRPPAPPDVYVNEFWPVFALTFNDVESESDLFPPSDIQLIYHMQRDYNTSRQGLREHRKAARPRFFFRRGAVDEQDQATLGNAEPFSASPLNLEPNAKITDVLMTAPVPGVDPNLYETGPYFQDVQFTIGMQEANLGGVAKATATESAIAANSVASSDSSSVDDLDAFLTSIARASGQILFREMSAQSVMQIVGQGALWPEGDLEDIANEMYLEVEAGSSGKPNQAVEINNWQKMLPFLIQIPGINPTWLAKETIKRLDDRVDMAQAIAAGIPSVVLQNQMGAPPPPDPMAAPGAQGAEGAQNGPRPPADTPGGSGPAFGSNQVP